MNLTTHASGTARLFAVQGLMTRECWIIYMYLLYLNPLTPKTATYFFLVIVLYIVYVWDLTDYLNNFQTKSILSLCRYLCFTPLTILRWVSSSLRDPSPQGAGVETLSRWPATISVGSLMKFSKPGLTVIFEGSTNSSGKWSWWVLKAPPKKDVRRLSKSNSDCKHLLHPCLGAVFGGCLNRPIVHCVEMKPNWFVIDVLPCCKLLHGSTNPKLSKAANSCWTGYGCWGAQFCFWSMPELKGKEINKSCGNCKGDEGHNISWYRIYRVQGLPNTS